MDISLITSLYRAERFLPQYIDRAVALVRAVQVAGYTIEILVIANDPTAAENDLLAQMQTRPGSDCVRIERVPRETLYASWNRGMAIASGASLGPWNVDDTRTPEALMEGCERIRGGCQLIYFPWRLYDVHRWLDIIPVPHYWHYDAEPFERDKFSVRMWAGPFFLFSPALFEAVGPFDERFRILGDLDWTARATHHTEFCAGENVGGTFYYDGGNLSNPVRRVVEENATFLKHGYYDHLIPCDPEAMRAGWQPWAEEYPLPLHVAERLWGAQAESNWRRWEQEQSRQARRTQLAEDLRMLPRLLIDRTGLRKLLFRLGVVKRERPIT